MGRVLNWSLEDIKANIQSTVINIATTTTSTVQAATTGRKYAIVGWNFNYTGTYTTDFTVNAVSVAGAQTFKADGINISVIGEQIFKGAAGEALAVINTRTGGDCDGVVYFVEY